MFRQRAADLTDLRGPERELDGPADIPQNSVVRPCLSSAVNLSSPGIPAESGDTPARWQRHDTSRARRHARMDSKAREPCLGGSTMTAQPADRIPASGPDTGSYEVIHLGGQAAVVVPVSDFLRLRALEQAASAQELEDAEDKAALADWRSREAAGQTSYVPHDEALRRLGLAG